MNLLVPRALRSGLLPSSCIARCFATKSVQFTKRSDKKKELDDEISNEIVEFDASDIQKSSREVLSVMEARKELERIAKNRDLIAPGAKPGDVPTDLEHATGVERIELLSKMAGIKFFDTSPLASDRMGTLADPVLVPAYYHERHIGCTGIPAESHELLWYVLKKDKDIRCRECGCVYRLNYLGTGKSLHTHDSH